MPAAASPKGFSVPCRALVGALVLAGCAGSHAPAPPANVPLPFDQAVAAASDQLVDQALRIAPFRAGAPPVPTVAEPVIEATTGQQTVATTLVERGVAQRLAARLDRAELVAFEPGGVSQARFLVTGTLNRVLADRPKGVLRIDLALTDLRSGTIVAQASAIARADGVDGTPLPCDAESPVRMPDKTVDTRVTRASTAAGRPGPPLGPDALMAAARLADADRRCNAGQPAEAVGRYREAASAAGGESLRALNGLYVTNTRLGRAADAEKAFDRLVAAGLAGRRFEVPFLFDPGSTVLTADSRYPVWLRRIARASAAAKVCLQVVGHTGASGTPAAAAALSLQRAAYIRQRLVGEAAVLGGRTRAIGAGNRENLVGSGTDDAIDALDRRIEFRVVACG